MTPLELVVTTLGQLEWERLLGCIVLMNTKSVAIGNHFGYTSSRQGVVLAIADFAKESDVNDLKKYGSDQGEYVLRVYAKTRGSD